MDFKQFKPSNWAIDNKTAIYIGVIIITLLGINSYNNLPKESFPDIVVPKFFISTNFYSFGSVLLIFPIKNIEIKKNRYVIILPYPPLF